MKYKDELIKSMKWLGEKENTFIEMSEKPSEESFGITSDMDNKEKCKVLRKEYTKWNAQTNHKEAKRKKRAKEMVKIIANLRKQYNC